MTADHGPSVPIRVIVGVSGGIAAYKAVSVVREFVLRGAQVTVIPTGTALKFVGRATWEAVSRNPVGVDLFSGVSEVQHVSLGQNADLIVLAPATANTLASVASGFATDLLGTTILASRAPLILAPAMHTEMWEKEAVQQNITQLTRRGAIVVGPDSGRLTGDDTGPGRMSDPVEIVETALSHVAGSSMKNQRVLISAGGTREFIDPVRYLGNQSSGAMGVSLARQAMIKGAEVTLVHANLEVPLPFGIREISVTNAAEMLDVMKIEQKNNDLILMAAAVADWSPETVAPEKLAKREKGERWTPALLPTQDILSSLAELKLPSQRLIGFAAETSNQKSAREEAALAKLDEKKPDGIVVNQVGIDIGFGDRETQLTLLMSSGERHELEGSKSAVADDLLEILTQLRAE